MEIKPIIRVENIVATATLDQNLDLSAVARTVSNVEYDPEEFPGLIYRLSKPRLTALIFNSGKMVITGAKDEDEVNTAVYRIFSRLRELECVREIPSTL
ncbi:MAG: hypothetical protein QXP80_06855 [Zestosphaera sp.]